MGVNICLMLVNRQSSHAHATIYESAYALHIMLHHFVYMCMVCILSYQNQEGSLGAHRLHHDHLLLTFDW